MKKKFIGIFCLFLIISSSNIFGKSLINIIYDTQGNKISLYDDHSWVMNDEGWNTCSDDSLFSGRYVIKEKGMKDITKSMLISEGTYPGSDDWSETVTMMNMALEYYTVEDLLDGSNFFIDIEDNKLTVFSDLEDDSEDIALELIDPSSNDDGYYIVDNNLYVSEFGESTSIGYFEDSDVFQMNMSLFLSDDESVFNGYEQYSYVSLERE